MSDIYKNFLNLNLDTGCLGLEKADNFSPYFCTPENSRIIGCEGVDGIHYCFIEKFGDMVFAVTPMDDEPSFVKPLAYSFEDFLRLLLALGNTAVIEQAIYFDRKDFYVFAEENKPQADALKALDAIKKQFNLEPMEEPWDYLKEISIFFDYDNIPFTKEYYETLGEEEEETAPWEVRFGDTIWSAGKPNNKKAAAREISVNLTIPYNGRLFTIPSIYISEEGITADILMEFDEALFKSFYDKWCGHEDYSQKEMMLMEYENPAIFNYEFAFILNGEKISEKSSSGGGFIENMEEAKPQIRLAIEHYHLHEKKSFYLSRINFKFKKKGIPEIDSLAFTIEEETREYPGESFFIKGAGDEVEIALPDGGKTCLKVLEYSQEDEQMENDEYIMPNFYTAMRYELSPKLPKEFMQIRDLSPSDNARKKESAPSEEHENSLEAEAIGIIGGADGPTAIFISPIVKKDENIAISSPSFNRKDIEWTPVFKIKGQKKQTFYIY